MTKKKKISIFCGVALAAVVLGGCKEKYDSTDIQLENYKYDVVAEVAEPDTAGRSAAAAFWRCIGVGVLPRKIGGHDVEALRDTLCRLARVDQSKSNPAPLLPEGYKDKTVASDKQEACSLVSNTLSIALVTPKVMVWQNYQYAYPCEAAHGTYSNTFVSYSLEDGKIVALDDLFQSGYAPKLTAMVREQLAGRDDLLVELDEIELPETFRLTSDGLSFVYGLFSIAPYSSGEITVDLNSNALSDIMKPGAQEKYFGD